MFLEWIALPGLALLLLVGMLALQEWGRRHARKQLDSNSTEADAGTSSINAAVFALLGLLLAFQFGGAASRLDARRTDIIREANAIGTAYLRVDLLTSESQPPLRDLFRRYVDARIGVYQAAPDLEKVKAEQQRANKLSGEIWSGVVKACEAKPGSGVNVLTIPAVNEMIDSASARDTVAMTHGSRVIAVFLMGVCLLASYLSGRATAPAPKRPVVHMVAFAVLTAATIYLILDLEYPRLGFIRIGVSDQLFLDLRGSMD